MKIDLSQNSAVWTGRYWLNDRDTEGVPFSTWMSVTNGKLEGSTLEPNKFVLINDEELDADISGHMADEEIVFLKKYRAFEHEPVYFEGELVDDGRRVVGQWYFGWPNEWTGPFEMTRSAADATSSQTNSANANPAV